MQGFSKKENCVVIAQKIFIFSLVDSPVKNVRHCHREMHVAVHTRLGYCHLPEIFL